MLLQSPKKKISTVIVARMKGKPEKAENFIDKMQDAAQDAITENTGAEKDASPGLEAAADEMIAAIKGGDAKALVAALKSFLEMCDYSEEDSEEEEVKEE